jgi:hypothetical protein
MIKSVYASAVAREEPQGQCFGQCTECIYVHLYMYTFVKENSRTAAAAAALTLEQLCRSVTAGACSSLTATMLLVLQRRQYYTQRRLAHAHHIASIASSSSA